MTDKEFKEFLENEFRENNRFEINGHSLIVGFIPRYSRKQLKEFKKKRRTE